MNRHGSRNRSSELGGPGLLFADGMAIPHFAGRGCLLDWLNRVMVRRGVARGQGDRAAVVRVVFDARLLDLQSLGANRGRHVRAKNGQSVAAGFEAFMTVRGAFGIDFVDRYRADRAVGSNGDAVRRKSVVHDPVVVRYDLGRNRGGVKDTGHTVAGQRVVAQVVVAHITRGDEMEAVPPQTKTEA